MRAWRGWALMSLRVETRPGFEAQALRGLGPGPPPQAPIMRGEVAMAKA